MSLNVLDSGGEELIILASLISIQLSKYYNNDDLNTLSNLFSTIGGNIALIVAQKERLINKNQLTSPPSKKSNNDPTN